MARGGIQFDTKFFLDKDKIFKALDRKTRTVLIRQGAFYRRVVQTSMRPGGLNSKSSKPGEPPRFQTKVLRNGIQFTFDRQNEKVVVGAAPLNKRTEVPKVMEYGGKVVPQYFKVDVKRKKGRNRRRNVFIKNDKRVSVNIKPRPFVGPKSINYKKGETKFRELVEKVELR